MTKVEQVSAGLQIVAKYGFEHDINAEHDIIMAGIDAAPGMSEEDKAAMVAAGWAWMDEYDCFGIFV